MSPCRRTACRRILSCALLLLVAAGAQPQSRAARVSIELFTEDGFGVDDSHRWYQLFTEIGVANLRIRGIAPGDEIGIHEVGKRDAQNYEVKGRIAANNVLQLPGGKFTLRDSARLKQWIKNLSEQGPDEILGQRERFGLTAVQLQELQDDLKRPIDFSTKDLLAADAVAKISGGLRHQVEMAPAARAALAKRHVADNLQGLSTGTALAAILRLDGMVLTPERPEGKATLLRIGAPVAGREAWPVGWVSEKPDRDLLPDYFKFITIEIDETLLVEATEPIKERLKIPFLWDRYAIDSKSLDLASIKIKLATKRLSYSMILQKILSQAGLQRELRVDDAGKPFLWITTVKPVTLGLGS